MAFFAESDGRVIVGKDDPDPMQCPDCRKLIPSKKADKGGKLRCTNCQFQGKVDEFKARFVEIAVARVLVAV